MPPPATADTAHVVAVLEKTRSSIGGLSAPTSAGVYAIFLTPGVDFPLRDLPSNRLVYVGSSTSLRAYTRRYPRESRDWRYRSGAFLARWHDALSKP